MSIPGVRSGGYNGKDAGDAIAELTAAVGLGGDSGRAAEKPVVPPPPPPSTGSRACIEEELDLPDPSANPAEKTEILPAETPIEGEEGQVDIRAPSEPPEEPRRPVGSVPGRRGAGEYGGKRPFFVLVLIGVVLAVAATAVMLACLYWARK